MRARRVHWFVAVGALAAAVHYVVALASHALAGAAPAWANLIGFCCAFPVSYAGHRWRTFADTGLSHRQAIVRFAVVAVGAFAANQGLLIVALDALHWPFWFALGTVLLAVAAGTFVLSRRWAFRP